MHCILITQNYKACFFLFRVLTTICGGNLHDQIGNKEYVPRVFNGWKASLGDVPYQVALKAKMPFSSVYFTFCGGSIIAPTKVLSAAHCFVEDQSYFQKIFKSGWTIDDISNKYVVAGNLKNFDFYNKVDSEESGQWRSIKNFTFPEDYNFPNYDIAILFTNTAFHYNDHVGPIPYASMTIDYVGSCLVSGYGLVDKYKQGDSGGPLVCMNTNDADETGSKGILVGIVTASAASRTFSLFTRVSYFKHYIDINRSSCITCSPITYLVLLSLIL